MGSQCNYILVEGSAELCSYRHMTLGIIVEYKTCVLEFFIRKNWGKICMRKNTMCISFAYLVTDASENSVHCAMLGALYMGQLTKLERPLEKSILLKWGSSYSLDDETYLNTLLSLSWLPGQLKLNQKSNAVEAPIGLEFLIHLSSSCPHFFILLFHVSIPVLLLSSFMFSLFY